jgi:hypothetical protein
MKIFPFLLIFVTYLNSGKDPEINFHGPYLTGMKDTLIYVEWANLMVLK